VGPLVGPARAIALEVLREQHSTIHAPLMYWPDHTRDAASAATVTHGIIARLDLPGDCMRSVPAGTAAVVVME
jgi:hypothetical protein